MKAAVVRVENGKKRLVTEHVPTPHPEPTQVLVRVTHAGICGSDLHGFLDGHGTARRDGLIMGHETAGRIVETGSQVAGLSDGDPVTIDPQIVCGTCPPCRQGWISICDRKMVTGSSLRGFSHGGMAEFLAVEASQAYSVPDGVTGAQAALIEPLANAMHVVERAGDLEGKVVVIIGAGPLGLCQVQALRHLGAGTILITDPNEFRLGVAKSLGAHHAVAPGELVGLVNDLTAAGGADVVIESVGIDTTYQQALAVVRKRGQVMFFGAVQDAVTLPLLSILHREVTLIGCTGANSETRDAIDALASGSINIDPLLTHTFALADADRAMRTLADPDQNAIKVQVTP